MATKKLIIQLLILSVIELQTGKLVDRTAIREAGRMLNDPVLE
jgi:hypothetical protein